MILASKQVSALLASTPSCPSHWQRFNAVEAEDRFFCFVWRVESGLKSCFVPGVFLLSYRHLRSHGVLKYCKTRLSPETPVDYKKRNLCTISSATLCTPLRINYVQNLPDSPKNKNISELSHPNFSLKCGVLNELVLFPNWNGWIRNSQSLLVF